MKMKTKILGERERRLDKLMKKAENDPVIKEVLEGKKAEKDREISIGDLVIESKPFANNILSTAFSSIGNLLAVGCQDDFVRLFALDYEKGTLEGIHAIKQDGHPMAVSFYQGFESKFEVARSDNLVRAYEFDYDSLSVRYAYSLNNTSMGEFPEIRASAFRSDGMFLAAFSEDYQIRVFETGPNLVPFYVCRESEWVFGLAFYKGKYLAIGKDNDLLTISEIDYNLNRLWSLFTQQLPDIAFGLSFDSSGKYLAVGSPRATGIFEVDYQNKYLRQVAEHEAKKNVLEVSFSPDGEYLLTGEQDHKVRIYKIERK